ncbi:hypothetical protein GQ600_22799 [Phytophthora cactorum]|nr:hypothetical protein GQ600_22799 [Phytophthora cactorum]
MRLTYIVMAAASILSAHHDTVTASAANDVALTGVVSLGFLHHVSADQRIGNQSRFLRGNKIAEGDNEERGFADVVEQLMAKTLSTTHDYMMVVFKYARDNKMRPEDLNKILKELPEADDAIRLRQ